MSQENVEAFKRAVDAINRGDIEASLKDLDPDVEFHAFMEELLGGEGGSIRVTRVSASSTATSANTSTSSTGSTRTTATDPGHLQGAAAESDLREVPQGAVTDSA